MLALILSAVFGLTVPAGTTVYYTTNGTTPTVKSTVYKSPIAVTQSMTIKAIAVNAQGQSSDVASVTYTLAAIAPVITSSDLTVTIASASPGVDIFYTVNGKVPTTSTARYTGPFTVTSGTTVRAIAAQTGWTTSTITTFEVTQ